MTAPMAYSVFSTEKTQLVWTTSATTNATGAVTVTLPAGVFTAVNHVSATAVRDTAAPGLACFALVRTYNTTQVAVQVFESKMTGIALGGNVEGLELATSAVTVLVTVIGN